MIVKKDLYGLQTSDSSFYPIFASILHDLDFFPSKADPDIWMHDCEDHWERVVLYAGKNSKDFIQSLLDIGFKLKGFGMTK
jgi:hypothetical protein